MPAAANFAPVRLQLHHPDIQQRLPACAQDPSLACARWLPAAAHRSPSTSNCVLLLLMKLPADWQGPSLTQIRAGGVNAQLLGVLLLSKRDTASRASLFGC